MGDRSSLVRALLIASSLLALAFGGWSCAKKETTETADTTATTEAMVSDANIAAIALAANQADVDNGNQARAKTKNSDVKGFANRMVADHTTAIDSAKALAGRLNLTPEENETSQQIKATQDSIRASIKDLTGADFDRAYIDNEVTYHDQLLQAIDQTLLPSAQNPDLKKLVNDTRGVVSSHLDHAKQVQAKLGASATR